MSLTVKVAHNTLVQITSKISTSLIGIAVIAVITRYLGQNGFGQYTTILTFLSFFGIIADLGLTLVTTQMISQPDIDKNKILSNLFGLRLVTATIFLGLAPLVVFFFPYEMIIKLGVAVTTLSFYFISLNQIFIGLFQKELRMDKAVISEVISKAFLLAGTVIAVKLNYGLLGIMLALTISAAVNFALNFIFSFSFAKIRVRFDREVWADIAKRSWPLALTIFFNLLYLKTDTLILSLIKSQAEVGIYGAAYRVIDLLITIPFMFAGLILPIMTAAWAKNNTEDFKNILQKSFDVIIIIALPMLVGTQFVAAKTMVLVAGNDFALSGIILKILILAAGIVFIGTIFSHAIIAINRQKSLIWPYFFTSVTSLAGYFIFIPAYSYYGAAWVTIYSEATIALFTAYLLWKYAKILPNFKIFSKALVSSLLMAAALYAVSLANDNLVALIAAGTLSYSLSLYLLRGLNFISLKELLSLPKK
ncbi:MAG: flippase [Patescibacteria group bacterium]